MKRIWIIAPFADIETVGVRNRFQYLANRLHNEEVEVIFFTSNFNHMKKKHVSSEVPKEYPYKVELIGEIGYEENVSIRRALSHIGFSNNLKKIIRKLTKPDVIYTAYPTMSASYVSGKYAKKNNIPFIIDVQDTWPESISSAINTEKLIVKLLMWPFTKLANKIYRMADISFGVSKTYAQRPNIKGTKCKEFIPVYIGAELDKFDNVNYKDIKINKSENDIWVTYIGTLSHSYDVETAIKAFDGLKDYKNIRLNILGSGPNKEKLIILAKKLHVNGVNVFFYEFMQYEKMVAILKESDIALNAIKGNAKQTITNKLGDYVAASLPILNSCQEKEVLDLITDRQLGLNYIPGDVDSLKDSIKSIVGNTEKRKKYSKNSREFAEEYFDRKESYKIIINKIKDIMVDCKMECDK